MERKCDIVLHIFHAAAAIGAKRDGVVECLVGLDVGGEGAIRGAFVVDVDLDGERGVSVRKGRRKGGPAEGIVKEAWWGERG